LDTVKADCMQLELHLHEAAELAQDRERGRRVIAKLLYARHDVATALNQVK